MSIRGNPLLWRLAEFMFKERIQYSFYPEFDAWDKTKNQYYDKASVLYGKIINNDFAGIDNHGD